MLCALSSGASAQSSPEPEALFQEAVKLRDQGKWVPVDPGTHEIVAKAPGHATRTIAATASEGEATEVVVPALISGDSDSGSKSSSGGMAGRRQPALGPDAAPAIPDASPPDAAAPDEPRRRRRPRDRGKKPKPKPDPDPDPGNRRDPRDRRN